MPKIEQLEHRDNPLVLINALMVEKIKKHASRHLTLKMTSAQDVKRERLESDEFGRHTAVWAPTETGCYICITGFFIFLEKIQLWKENPHFGMPYVVQRTSFMFLFLFSMTR